ncbi:MAG TPA: hypothetical protein DCZ75_07430 [Geobacter sp.]|nr:hypothetical protein [Geobacter sp.]
MTHRLRWAYTVVLALLISLVAEKGMSQTDHVSVLIGKWEVTGVRLDETLMRRPNYNYDDPELVGRWMLFSRKSILTNTPEDTSCQHPLVRSEVETIEGLVGRTMAKAKYSGGETNKFALPVDTMKNVEVLWVTCKKGHIGPDTPFGPENFNWIARLSDNELAMRWYDNTILLLKRQPK